MKSLSSSYFNFKDKIFLSNKNKYLSPKEIYLLSFDNKLDNSKNNSLFG